MSDDAEICGPVFLCKSGTGVYIWYSDVFLFSLGKEGKKEGVETFGCSSQNKKTDH